MAQINLTLDSEVWRGLFTADGKDEALAGLVSVILNQVLNAQASKSARSLTSAAKTGAPTVTVIGNGNCTRGLGSCN